jgi:hypothetical protein
VVDASEPVLQLGVLVSVLVDLVDGLDKVVERGVVSEALEQSLEVGQPFVLGEEA